MTQGVMRVEEYDCHFMKMMRYAPDDTNTDPKKQFWFLRGLHHGLRQALKASKHKSLRHLVNRAIAVEDERRSHEERMRGKKRMGDRDQLDRSFQKQRSGQSNMLRGSYRPGHNQPGCGFGGGGRSPVPGGRNLAIPSRLEATLVLHQAPQDPPREASPSPASHVASPATSPTTAQTRRPLLLLRENLLQEADLLRLHHRRLMAVGG
jgi:hypothetical protein